MTTRDSVPAWKLERFVLGELPAADLAQLNQQLQADPDLQQRVDALRAADVEIRGTYPAPWMARQILARVDGAKAATSSRRWVSGRWARWGVAPLAAAALLAVIALPRTQQDDGTTPARFVAAGVRSKGPEATLYVHRRTQSGTEQLADGSVARRGDLLRLQYRIASEKAGQNSDAPMYGVILSLDGGGAVTRHLPVQGDVAAPLVAGELVSLDLAYELDDAPGWERFVLITAAEPFALAPVVATARAAVASTDAEHDAPMALDLPATTAQTGVTLIKVKAPAKGGRP